jgi:ribosomal protein L23
LKTDYIHLYYKEDKLEKNRCLLKVTYRDDKGQIYNSITNNFEITVEEVVLIYKMRPQIELLFKKLKQNFQLHCFYSKFKYGIRAQIWITLVAQQLMMVLKTLSDKKKVFPRVAALVIIHLRSNLDVFWIIENSRRTYTKRPKRSTSPHFQIELF